MGAALVLKQSCAFEAIPALMACWQDSDGDVYQIAKQALASLGGPAVIPLIRRLHSEAEAEHDFVCEALREMAYNGGFTSGLGPYLYECDKEIKLFLIELIGISGEAESISYLINLASMGGREETDPINAGLVDALSKIVAASSLSLLEQLPVTPEVEAALDQLQRHVSSVIVRWRDAHGFIEFSPPPSQELG